MLSSSAIRIRWKGNNFGDFLYFKIIWHKPRAYKQKEKKSFYIYINDVNYAKGFRNLWKSFKEINFEFVLIYFHVLCNFYIYIINLYNHHFFFFYLLKSNQFYFI